MFTQITEHEWLKLPLGQRRELIEVFKIPQSSFTHVSGGQVVTDGHTNQDLQAINIPAMQQYTGSNSPEFIKLFAETLKKINPNEEIKETAPAPQVVGGTDGRDKRPDGSEPKAGNGKEQVVSAPVGNQQVNRGR